jgi:hypothetical protein
MIMKTPFFLLTLILLSSFNGNAQEEFSFQLYFEDGVGNRDTLTLGYDDNATSGLDPIFGETNSITQPWDSVFEVRITDKMPSILYNNPENETFRTKKQVIKKHCGEPWNNWDLIYIDAKIVHFPLTISWSPEILDNQCILGSILQDYEIEAWFDVGNFNGHLYHHQNSITYDGSNMTYSDVNDSTIYSYWLMFGDSSLLTLNNTALKTNLFKIYPNPIEEHFQFVAEQNVSLVQITDLQGNKVSYTQDGNTFNLMNCKTGVYIVSFEVNGELYHQRLIKK